MTRAAVYLRISQDATGQHLGVTRQQEDCLEVAAHNGWEVVETYVDNDISAYKERPGYKRMLADVQAGKIDGIIAWAPDRIYRRLADLEALITVIEAHNVQIRTVKAGDLDLSSAYGRMLARILGSVAAGEGEIKSERWRRSYRQGREAGRRVNTGSRTFGYTRELEIIEDEAAVVRHMAQHILEGGGILSLARWLDDREIRGTRGKAWTPASIKRLLTNPRLAGWSTLKGEIVTSGDWQPILEPETWEAVRALLTARTRAYAPRVSILTGLLFCGACQTRMVTSGSRGKRNYRCPNRPGWDGCGKVSTILEPLEEMVEAYARTRLADPRVRQRIAELRAQPADDQEELAALELRVTELERELDQPGVPVATILRAIDRAKSRQSDLLDSLAARNRAPIPVEGEVWPDDIQRRRALIDLVVARVELYPATKPSALGFDPERVKIDPR